MGGLNAKEHALLSVFFAHDEAPLIEVATRALRTAFAKSGVTELASYDAAALPNQAVHFGYRDGISQPHIAGVPSKRSPDMQPQSSAGEFILGAGYTNQYGGNFIGDLPTWLCNYGSYSAVRILEQDAAGFEQLLADVAARFDVDPEWVAAKMMGRWRDGSPLTLTPHAPDPKMPAERINKFDYAPSLAEPTYYDDYDGMRCPIGAHARRLNPRSALVTGKPHSRRLIRRGMAYGPPFDPAHPQDGIERGLFGFFVCGDLEMQSASGGTFVIPRPGGLAPISFYVPRLIHTRGGLYTFLPGMAALKNLAQGSFGAVA
jgi:deferrochelatase/peroxidase EfeB